MSTARTTPLTENPDSMAELLGDCRRTAAHWKYAGPAPRKAATPSGIHGVRVSAASARALGGMAEYGA